jgi:hypothetical protein
VAIRVIAVAAVTIVIIIVVTAATAAAIIVIIIITAATAAATAGLQVNGDIDINGDAIIIWLANNDRNDINNRG